MGFIPINDANDGSQLCIEAPQGVQSPPGLPTEEGVELITQTVLSFEGGVTAFDTTDIRDKFEAAVAVAMASGPDGLLGVQCKVSAVTDPGSGRRLALSLEGQAGDTVATTTRHELVDVSASSRLQLGVQEVQDAAARLKGQLAALMANDAAAAIACLATTSATLNDLIKISTVAPRRALTSMCYTLNMADSFGDGWNGNTWNWADSSGVHNSSDTLPTGSSGTAQLCFPAGVSCMDFSITQGSYPSEVSWYITDTYGAAVASVRTMQTSADAPFFVHAVACAPTLTPHYAPGG